ncbi:MAG: beta-glucosidase/6-phospho-beta-glucosidase/beta-galactosidase [Acidimicrobiales bacterium]|nr:beta-glucosidase/6-phospho-beta-glucosidase/beta-galactosidase [Acidimicrobiales bacterium]
MKWPEGFLWGTGASSTQCEGAAPASDWWDWERAGHAPRSGDGNGFAAIDRGVDVRGFFHWTATDNYEWLHGDEVAFGLMDRDRNVRPSAKVLQREALP